MAALRAHQFYAGTVTSTVFTTLYTVPTGKTIILRSAAIHNTAAAAGGIILRCAGMQLFFASLAASGGVPGSVEWRPWLVLGPGQLIEALVGSGVHADLVLSGSLLFV